MGRVRERLVPLRPGAKFHSIGLPGTDAGCKPTHRAANASLATPSPVGPGRARMKSPAYGTPCPIPPPLAKANGRKTGVGRRVQPSPTCGAPVEKMGLEPTRFCLQSRCTTIVLLPRYVAGPRLELGLPVYETGQTTWPSHLQSTVGAIRTRMHTGLNRAALPFSLRLRTVPRNRTPQDDGFGDRYYPCSAPRVEGYCTHPEGPWHLQP